MRELTLEELELVAGGTDTGDIVVTGDRGDFGDFGDFGDYGGYGDYGGDGGGGGDTVPPPPAPPIIVQNDPVHHTATVSIPVAGTNVSGGFTVDDSGLKTLNLTVTEGGQTFNTTFDLSHGIVGEYYTASLGNGQTISVIGSTDGNSGSVNIGYSLHF